MNILKRLARWFNEPEPIEKAQRGIFHSSAPRWRRRAIRDEEELEKQLKEMTARYHALNHPEADPADIEVKLVGEIINESTKTRQ